MKAETIKVEFTTNWQAMQQVGDLFSQFKWSEVLPQGSLTSPSSLQFRGPGPLLEKSACLRIYLDSVIDYKPLETDGVCICNQFYG